MGLFGILFERKVCDSSGEKIKLLLDVHIVVHKHCPMIKNTANIVAV